MNNAIRRVKSYGARPADLAEESSLKEILDARELYSEEPKNLAPYGFKLVQILHRKVYVRPIYDELPPLVQGYLRWFPGMIEKDEGTLERERAEGTQIRPYWDPRLRASRTARTQLYVRLFQQGLLSFRRRLKSRAGIFTVRKKDGMQRLIIDARCANWAHRSPPTTTTRLGSPRCMAEIGLSDPRLLSTGFGPIGSFEPAGVEGDVGGCFYNFSVPELASWIGFADTYLVSELRSLGVDLRRIYDDDALGYTDVHDWETVHPATEAVCMGWSWALFFANESVAKWVADMGPPQMPFANAALPQSWPPAGATATSQSG